MAFDDKFATFKKDMELMESMLNQLKREYDMYFAGVLKKQPFELKAKLEALMRKHRATNVHKLELTFRFGAIQAKFAKFVELWDKILKRREIDPHARSPYGPSREQLANEMKEVNKGRSDIDRQERALNQPAAAAAGGGGDNIRGLYDQYVNAKREAGEKVDNLKYESFQRQIQKQKEMLKAKTGGSELEFSVTRKGGKVSLSAKKKKA